MTIYYWSGKPLFVSGEIAIDSGCCCKAECDLCDDTGAYGESGESGVISQNPITIVASGTCSSDCLAAEGTYHFDEKYNPGAGRCRFWYEKSGGYELEISVSNNIEVNAWLYAPFPCLVSLDDVTATCDSDTGLIDVTGAISGINASACSGSNCSGCMFYVATES